jgi:hypothetical protein
MQQKNGHWSNATYNHPSLNQVLQLTITPHMCLTYKTLWSLTLGSQSPNNVAKIFTSVNYYLFFKKWPLVTLFHIS